MIKFIVFLTFLYIFVNILLQKEFKYIQNKHKHPICRKEKTVLIYGRGPSAYKSKINTKLFDHIIRLKTCNRKYNNYCDIVVYHYNELESFQDLYFDFINSNMNEVWITNTKNKRFKNKFKEHKDKILIVENKYLMQIANDNGFNWYEAPRFTTGMIVILEAIRLFKNPVYITGFDNIINGTYDSKNLHFDNFDAKRHLSIKYEDSPHDMYMEHLLFKKLEQNNKIVVV